MLGLISRRCSIAPTTGPAMTDLSTLVPPILPFRWKTWPGSHNSCRRGCEADGFTRIQTEINRNDAGRCSAPFRLTGSGTGQHCAGHRPVWPEQPRCPVWRLQPRARTVQGGPGDLPNPEVAERFSYLCAYGFKADYNCRYIGLNGKVSELNAALGWLSLDLLDTVLTQRHAQEERYHRALADIPELAWQAVPPGRIHGYKGLAVRVPRADFARRPRPAWPPLPS